MGTRGRTAALLVVLTALAAAPAAGQDPTGRWEARWASAIRTERDGSITIQRRSDAVLVLEAAGDSLAGTWTFELPATGRSVWTVVGQRFGDRLSLMATENETERPPPPSQGTIARQEWRGTVADGRIEGEMWMVLSLPGGEERRSGPRPWSAVRSGGEEVSFRSARGIAAFAPSPIDRFLAVTLQDDPDGTAELVRVDLDGSGEPIPLVSTRFEEGAADLSPDGQWVAYVSTVPGRSGIYVAAWPEGDRRSAISIAGDSAPRWSPTGEELSYRGDAQMMVAGLEISDRVSVVSRTALFELPPFETGGPVATYDVVDGGERLLVISEGTGGRLDRRIRCSTSSRS